ncbi:putative linoleate 9S-lipoxygenase 4 [Colletotrichum liriopes]|uniref:Manganese lipoxygenase n=1 Tax=Colletotrichum liriopes TaxID=708192 RepID=A0AA37LVP4_9PEZI|nr:putative linoleate 9S-lipoxygenase 4 [Colletotrichum liriopes]
MSPAILSAASGVDHTSELDRILNAGIKYPVEESTMDVWDKGVFLNELQRQGIVLGTGKDGLVNDNLVARSGLEKGTYKGTQLALTEIYSLVEDSAASHFDTQGFEPIFPTRRTLEQKQALYKWSDPADGLPPHLNDLPDDEKATDEGLPQPDRPNGVGSIFDKNALQVVRQIGQAVSFIIPGDMAHEDTPYEGPTLAKCEAWNRLNLKEGKDIMQGANIGQHDDWYSDARFAQQHLSGVNPSTIEAAPADRIQGYITEARKQGLTAMETLLCEGKDLLMQDYSYFREATETANDTPFQCKVWELNAQNNPTGQNASRYACAPVVIFQLLEDGRLHPLVITIDFKGSLDDSITIFNKRTTPDEGGVDEKEDWPWRYAKTCAQTADWARHEIASHLVDTHMIEESIIVATNRTIPEDHLLYEILSPHWYRTLALNYAARQVLVPMVIARVSGLGPSWPMDPKNRAQNNAYKLINWSYKNFNFQDKYIPRDLKKRGFDIEGETGTKYRNYPYATNMYMLWNVIHDFVRSVLETRYKSDAEVQQDPCIAAWCKEIQVNGQIPTFPTITSFEQLTDAVTMCIHTASPQHTAVNYLQRYYYSFVPSKPAALCTPLPRDLRALQAYTEQDLTEALPIGTQGPKWKDWLLSAQLPELLSFKVDERYNLLTYAKSLYNVNKSRTVLENKKYNSLAIAKAAALLFSRLKDLGEAFKFLSGYQTKGAIAYPVLQPESTAVSILI